MKLRNWLQWGTCGVVLIVGLAVEAGPPPAGKPPTPEEIFAKFDKNADGFLTSAEAPMDVWAKVKGADANKDGKVSLAELKAFIAGNPPPKPPTPEQEFAKLDKNADGFITSNEVSVDCWNKLKAADTNKDGKVSKAEFIAAAPVPKS